MFTQPAPLAPNTVHPDYSCLVGTSPAGTEWRCYARRGDSPYTFGQRMARMRENLSRLWDKHAAKMA